MTADLNDVSLLREEQREYIFENRLNLPTLVHYAGGLTVELNAVVTDEWIRGLFHLNGTSEPNLRRIVPSMYAAIPKETIAASIEIDGRIVATGLGIRDRDYIGIYANTAAKKLYQSLGFQDFYTYWFRSKALS